MILANDEDLDCKKIAIGEHSFQRMFERNIEPGDVIDTVRDGRSDTGIFHMTNLIPAN